MIHWIPNSFSISIEGNGSQTVQGMTSMNALFGIHFADHRAIHVTHLGTGRRVHPEPGFADIRSAAEFADRILHLDWENATRLDHVSLLFLAEMYNDYLISR